MNISFHLTLPQFRDRTKTVTRRLGWHGLVKACARGKRPIIKACENCHGLKAGEKMQMMGLIRVTSARFERLDKLLEFPDYGRREVIREGFPEMSHDEFVNFFIRAHANKQKPTTKKTTKKTMIVRIEFEYLDGEGSATPYLQP